MIGALILGCGLLTALPSDVDSPPKQSSKDFKDYQAAAAHVKRDPDAHVKLALWCEQHGLEAERITHLALAVLIQRDNETARLARPGCRLHRQMAQTRSSRSSRQARPAHSGISKTSRTNPPGGRYPPRTDQTT